MLPPLSRHPVWSNTFPKMYMHAVPMMHTTVIWFSMGSTSLFVTVPDLTWQTA